MLDAGAASPGLPASASSLLPFPPPKHGKQLIFLFPPGLPVAATLWGRRARGASERERRLDEGKNAGHARTEPPAAVTARRPCPGVSAPTRRLHFVERHARARRAPPDDQSSNSTDRRGAGERDGPVAGFAQATGEGHEATTGRWSMADGDGDGNGRKALEIEGSKGLPRERGIGGEHRWRGGGRRGRLSLAGGVDRTEERSKTRGWERADHA